ncbi:hypothetical protein J2X97_001699 [Epilithonimonas hungarica]|nr:hypothetical protein [Epilithonimonas hungarica]
MPHTGVFTVKYVYVDMTFPEIIHFFEKLERGQIGGRK